MIKIFNKKGKKYDYLQSHIISTKTNTNLISICVENVFSSIECEELINLSESVGYEKTSLFEKNGIKYFYNDIRNSLRCIIDDTNFASVLKQRISHLIPIEYKGKKFDSINPRFRFLKYNETLHHFVPHTDDYYSTDKIISMITILIYLNIDYEGARTSLNLDSKTIIGEIIPQIGLVYMMDQDILHSVPNLISGTKYVIRTELMYLIK